MYKTRAIVDGESKPERRDVLTEMQTGTLFILEIWQKSLQSR
jgi:hypothetical protein